MANEYAVNQADLTSVANAIREKGGTSEQLVFPSGFVSAIQAIEGGGIPTIPEFTYSEPDGYYPSIDPVTGVWKITFIKSGKLKFTKTPQLIDIFAVGGGGGSSNHDGSSVTAGGGGYTTTQKNFLTELNKEYTITIGAGGGTDTDGADGGTTSAFGVIANGGRGGQFVSGVGGDGGSGGNGYQSNSPRATDGADGFDGPVGYAGGTGQHQTTREFGETTGKLYASGGATDASGSAGGDNTGDGGGGMPSVKKGNVGGSGIVIIRGVAT